MYFDRASELQTETTVSSPIALGDAFAWLREQPAADVREHALRTVLVDIDGILFPFLRAFASHLGQTWTELDCPAWKSYPSEHSDEQITAALHYAHSEAGMRAHGLYDHAVSEIARLQAHGLTIVICTRRSVESGMWTQAWLAEQGIHADDFLAGPDLHKTQIALAMGASALIDDKPKTIEQALAAGLDVYSLAWPYNDERHIVHERFARAESWPQLADLVLAGTLARLQDYRSRS